MISFAMLTIKSHTITTGYVKINVNSFSCGVLFMIFFVSLTLNIKRLNSVLGRIQLKITEKSFKKNPIFSSNMLICEQINTEENKYRHQYCYNISKELIYYFQYWKSQTPYIRLPASKHPLYIRFLVLLCTHISVRRSR